MSRIWPCITSFKVPSSSFIIWNKTNRSINLFKSNLLGWNDHPSHAIPANQCYLYQLDTDNLDGIGRYGLDVPGGERIIKNFIYVIQNQDTNETDATEEYKREDSKREENKEEQENNSSNNSSNTINNGSFICTKIGRMSMQISEARDFFQHERGPLVYDEESSCWIPEEWISGFTFDKTRNLFNDSELKNIEPPEKIYVFQL